MDKDQGKTKHEAPSSVNYRATQKEQHRDHRLKTCKM